MRVQQAPGTDPEREARVPLREVAGTGPRARVAAAGGPAVDAVGPWWGWLDGGREGRGRLRSPAGAGRRRTRPPRSEAGADGKRTAPAPRRA